MNHLVKNWRYDVPASIVVFLVALPLCIGIAFASTGSNTSILTGIIAGGVGGIVVGLLSKSSLGVSGPAAGLIVFVMAGISTLGSFEAFLVATILAGIIQLIAGFLKAGSIGNYFPTPVIKGMLAAIGISLILKILPHLVGYDKNFFGDEAFIQTNGQNTFSDLVSAIKSLNSGAVIISLVSIFLLLLFNQKWYKDNPKVKMIPGAIIVVIISICLNQFFHQYIPTLNLKGKQLIQFPELNTFHEFSSMLNKPDWSILSNWKVYSLAFTLAIVASLEALLCVEATDKLDPEKRKTVRNHELKAQGIGNIVSGLLGGLPLTQVIVRSSANFNSGGKSKLSTILHGFLLVGCVLLFPHILNLIPLSALAAILLFVGYQLTSIELCKEMLSLGKSHFIIFVCTILGILFTDLLVGIFSGMFVAFLFNFQKKSQIFKQRNLYYDVVNQCYKIEFSEKITYLYKNQLAKSLQLIPPHSTLIIDGSRCKSIDKDIIDLINTFEIQDATPKQIKLARIAIPSN